MGIDLSWEKEDGTPIERVEDPQGRCARLVQTADLGGTVCLRFVDPYGDATFNQLQIPELLRELEELMGSQDDPAVREQVRHMLDLAAKARGRTHTYLRFIGD